MVGILDLIPGDRTLRTVSRHTALRFEKSSYLTILESSLKKNCRFFNEFEIILVMCSTEQLYRLSINIDNILGLTQLHSQQN